MTLDLEEIKTIVKENQQEILILQTKIDKLRRRLTWTAIVNTIKFLIIIVPILFGLLYFRPQIQTFMQTGTSIMQQFQDLTGASILHLDESNMQDIREKLYPSLNP